MSAKANRGKQGRGRNRRDVLPNFWQRSAPDLEFGEEEFTLTCFRPERKNPKERKVSLDPFNTNFGWEDAGPILRGTVTLNKVEGKKPLAVNEGHIIQLESAHKPGGKKRVIWRMRVESVNASAAAGTHEVQIADEMAWLQKSRDDWMFKKAKKGKANNRTKRVNGWLAHQIAKEVCRRYGVKVGRLAKGTHRITNLTEKNASPLEIIMKAYKIERSHTGRKFVVRMREGKLEVVLLRRSKTLLLLGETLIEATIARSLRKGLATAAHVRATLKDGKKERHKKLEAEVVAKRASKRYGFVRTTIRLEDPVHSKAEARKLAKRKLITSMRPSRQVTLEHPGVSSLFRGDAIKLRLPELGLTEIVYVKSVAHSVSSGQYTMSVTCGFQDPHIDKKGEEIRKKRCEEARKHGRTPPDFCSGEKRPQPRQAVARSEAVEGQGR